MTTDLLSVLRCRFAYVPKRIAVTGGRDFADWEKVWQALDIVAQAEPDFVLVHGACPTGADAHAHAWGVNRRQDMDISPADWKRYGWRAGFRRNQEMVDSGLDGCLVFPGKNGTARMVSCCTLGNVPMWFLDGR